MKLNLLNTHWLNKLLPKILFLGICTFILFWVVRRDYLLTYDAKYTIGATQSIFYLANRTKHVSYTFKVNGIEFEGSDDYKDTNDIYLRPEDIKKNKGIITKVPGGRYYVKFSKINPALSELLQNKPVSDSIKVAPLEGWDTIPE